MGLEVSPAKAHSRGTERKWIQFVNLCGLKPFEFGRNLGELAVLGPVRAFSGEPESALTSWLCPRSLDAIMGFIE